MFVVCCLTDQFQVLATVHECFPLACYHILDANPNMHIHISVRGHLLFVAQQDWIIDSRVSRETLRSLHLLLINVCFFC